MAGLYVHTSNRLEILAKELALLLKNKDSSPLEPSIIMIQSRGMERWLSMQIALHNGICANVRFLFPNSLIYELFNVVLEDISEDSWLDVEFMKWKLMKILPEWINKGKFSVLKRYIEGDKKDLRLFQLCHLIADTFDQYIIFRPDMILRWEEGFENHWQAELFRLLIKETNGLHRAKIARLFADNLANKKDKLPRTIYVFGISSIPKFHMDILACISNVADVHLFLMNPCKEYWGDVLSEKEIRKKGGLFKKELHMEKGNPLLSSLGKLGRDFFDIINEYEIIEMEKFEDIKECSLLSYIQSDILNLRDPESMEKRQIREDDLSVQIHICHSPLREVEVLYDRILDMLEKDPELKPRDILVMTPDIEAYTPFIQAVFGSPDPDIKIPFSIADRSPRWESEAVMTFFRILKLKESRFEASKVLEILEAEPISRMFGISMDEMKVIRRWVKESGIRWGIDKENRKSLGLLPTDIGTWDEGIKRLVLGYAMLNKGYGAFEDIFPYDKLEGGEGEILGRFVEFLERLFKYVKDFSVKKTLQEWGDFFSNLIDELFFVNEDNYKEIQFLRGLIHEMVRMGELSGFCEKVDIDVPIWNMEKAMDKKGYGSKFLTGGITFCAMLPMRSIPFKVICLIGMNYDSFPRHSNRWEFDLIQKNPRKGDRSKRNDDRYLFLETLVSARDTLYISYTGQSIKDNTPIPPSVVVSELIDYIEQGFYVKSGDIIDHITFTHSLHSFSPKYFRGDSRFFSYSEKNMMAAKNMLSKRQMPEPFISKELFPPEDKWKKIDIEDLYDFFSNPCKFLLKRRLNISLDRYEDIVKDMEPLRLKGLDKYRFEQELLNQKISNSKAENFIRFFQLEGLLPLGNVGEYEFKKAEYGIEKFVGGLKEYLEKEREEIELEVLLDDFLIRAKIGDIYSKKLFLYRYAKIRAVDRIRIWLYHLIAMVSGILLEESIFMGLDDNKLSTIRLLPMEKDEAKEILKDMLDIYWQGLTRPLHFFPESSWKYFESVYIKGEEHRKALQKARNQWIGNDYSRGEGQDEYYEFCFRGLDPLDAEFIKLSKRIFLPISLHTKRENEGA